MADWSNLTRRLEASGAPRLEFSFAEIEQIIGAPLPASSQYQAFWSNSSAYAKAWKRAGYATTRRGVLAGHMGFVRTLTHEPKGAAVTIPPTPLNDARGDAPDVVLVGCVKTKADHFSQARDLYRSPMFERRRRYAESTGKPWYILSAEHGLLDPESIVEPYDVYLAEESDDYRRAWGDWIAAKLARVRGPLSGQRIEVHASATYVEAIESPLRRRGAVVICPLAGLRQGEQLSWYDRPATTDSALVASPPDETVAAPAEDLVILDGPHQIGSFTFRWPESTEEEFDRGWDLIVEVAGRRRRVRHGLGTRHVYGAPRRHSVTFVDDWAAAEGVAADDYETSRCLISALKDYGGRLIRDGDTLPAPYAAFPIVWHAEQIVAPYSREAVAVRLHEDDITSWVVMAAWPPGPVRTTRRGPPPSSPPRRPPSRQLTRWAPGADLPIVCVALPVLIAGQV